MIQMRGMVGFVFFASFILFSLQEFSSADTIYLKSGDVVATSVERYSDGAFWVRDGKKTYILDPKDIMKIVFTRDLETLTPTGKRRTVPASKHGASSPSSSAILSVQPAAASGGPSEFNKMDAADSSSSVSERGLAILNYTAQMSRGIFQIVGEVENQMDTAARYVKVSVALMDGIGTVLDQNFSYVRPGPPHLKSGERKGFRVSFLNPRPDIAKYKIRVESSPY